MNLQPLESARNALSGEPRPIPLTIEPYSYSAIVGNDIRLITLMPGDFHDDIRIRIAYTALKTPESRPTLRMNLDELKETLPSGWDVYETLDNNYFFYCGELKPGGVFKSSWTHPDPTVDRSCYELPLDEEHSGDYPSYEALSYTWGSTHNVAKVWVKTSSPGAYLSIGLNLDCALRHLRYKDKIRTLWVDAVSINQGDISERDRQVRRMTDIYRFADRVIVWLGPEADNSGHALATVEFLGKQVVYTLDEWLAIQNLLLRHWFERVWVVQEIQLANRNAVVKCGNDEISWTHFRYGVVALWQKDSVPSTISRRRLALAGRIGAVNNFKGPISAVLRLGEGRYCSDPRDVIYGLLGLFSFAFSMKVRPQYALSVGEVYKDFFLAHMEHTGSLELLRNSNSLGCRHTDSPSWVPDFSSQYVHDIERQFYSGYSCSVAKFHPPNILDVTVTEPVPSHRTHSSSAQRLALEAVRKWEPKDLQTNSYITGESLLIAYAKTLTANYLRERFPAAVTATLEEWVCQDSKYALFGEKAKKPLGSNIALSRQEDYALNLLMEKTYITTCEGYIGLGPAQARECDIICAILGLDLPMLLRTQQDGNFLIVGPCFVYGLNDVNAFLGPLLHPWRVQIFHDSDGFLSTSRFLNSVTNCLSEEDPRLEPLSDWDRLEVERTGDDPFLFQCFKNKATGEVMRSDPRLLPKALESRGVKLETFSLA